MDFLKKFATESTGKVENKDSSDQSQPASHGDLLASAQLVADAARSTIQKEPNKVDNAKVAGAAADLLDAAETYGKLDSSTGIGSYVDKAQNYLHQYETSQSTTTTTAEAGEPKPTPPLAAAAATEGELKKLEPESETKSGESEGADMMKIAGDFLKKH